MKTLIFSIGLLLLFSQLIHGQVSTFPYFYNWTGAASLDGSWGGGDGNWRISSTFWGEPWQTAGTGGVDNSACVRIPAVNWWGMGWGANQESRLEVRLNTAGRLFIGTESYSFKIKLGSSIPSGRMTLRLQENSSGTFVDIANSTYDLSSFSSTEFITYSCALPSLMGNRSSVFLRIVIRTLTDDETPEIITDDMNLSGGALQASGFSGTYYVGAGQSYISLTNAGGFFSAVNSSHLSGDVTVYITSDLSEDGTHTLNQWSEQGVGGYSMFIRPDGPTVRSIIGSSTGGNMIQLNGVDRLTIDGRWSGSGKYLRFRNTASSFSSMIIYGGVVSLTIRNCILEGIPTGGGVVAFSTGSNSSNAIIDCDIRDRSDVSGRPYYGVEIYGAGNSNTTISGCNIYDFSRSGIYIDGGASGTIITKNNIYMTTASSRTYVSGIEIGNAPSTVISKNKIYDLNGTSTATIIGIDYSGWDVTMTVSIENNMFTLSPSTTGTVYGINYFAYNTNSCNIYYNSVYIGGTLTSGSNRSAAVAKREPAANFVQTNNIFVNGRTNSGDATARHYAAYFIDTDGLISLNHNIYHVSGSGGTLGYWVTNRTTLTAWQTASSQDPQSKSFAPDFFSTSDLHLNVSSTNMNYAGTPIIGITTDIDDDLRDAGYPYIGADEVLAYPLPVQLASFTGSVVNGNDVLLEWMTISEINNYGFYVERRGELEEQFTEIPNSFVQGTGTTLEPQYYSFIDNTITKIGFYYYRLKQFDNDGLIHYSQPISINVTTLSVRELATMALPLHQNYPNPFNSTTTILFSLPSKSFVSLKIFDILGKEVATLVNEELSSGKNAKKWNAESLPSGVYLYRLQVGSITETKKLLLLR